MVDGLEQLGKGTRRAEPETPGACKEGLGLMTFTTYERAQRNAAIIWGKSRRRGGASAPATLTGIT